jgi:hypothetical protein
MNQVHNSLEYNINKIKISIYIFLQIFTNIRDIFLL